LTEKQNKIAKNEKTVKKGLRKDISELEAAQRKKLVDIAVSE